jgi:uncharacterized UPF0146 family protein
MDSRLKTVTIIPIVDFLLLPFAIPAAIILKAIRRVGLHRLKMCRAVLVRIGVLPINKHYYEPFVDARDLRRPLEEARSLPGIDWNIPGQLELLDRLRYAGEIAHLATPRNDPDAFYLDNGSFERGDAEFFYQFIREVKPRRIIEVGGGNSTRIAREALARNRAEGHECIHICIEPFEQPWLEEVEGLTVLRQKVEEVDRSLFQTLQAQDILFIDSSHVIRPQGDVLTEYLEILPTLRPGVIVHIHDILSPRDYHVGSVVERMWLWNEQYLLEAFLSHNRSWKVIGALNLLKHRHFEQLRRVCPFLKQDTEPGSIYIQRVAE